MFKKNTSNASLAPPPSSTTGKSAAAGVETAAYALLAMATVSPADYLDDMQKVVKWISSKRNGQGGFVSTQVTVVVVVVVKMSIYIYYTSLY